MKNLLPFLMVSFFLSGLVYAQIPNASFENWTGGNPDGWFTNNSPGTYTTISQTSSAHSGSSAVQGTVISYFGYTFTPILLSGTDGLGFPSQTHPGSFHGFYKMTSIGGDFLGAYIYFVKNGLEIGGGGLTLGDASSYTEFSTDITWTDTEDPDSAVIGILVFNNDSVHVGTTFYLDDLSFSDATEVQDNNIPVKFDLSQNYPNPFNPSTVINYSIPKQSFVSLRIYNLLGQEVATLVNEEKSAGIYKVEFSASNFGSNKLASGIYIYKLTAGDLVQTKKMMLLK